MPTEPAPGAGGSLRRDVEKELLSAPTLYVGAVVQSCMILRCFTAQRPVIGIAELRRETGISLATLESQLRTLVELGQLERTPEHDYRLGLGVMELGMAALSATGLVEVVHEHLAQLRDDTGYTVGLAVLDGDEVVYVDRLVGSRGGSSAIDLDVRAGARLPASWTAAGRMLLAHMPDHARDLLLSSPVAMEHENVTMLHDRELDAQLERARREDLAVEDGERVRRLAAIAVPVRDRSGDVVAAIDATARKPLALLSTLLPRLRLAARRSSQRLGYDPPAHRPIPSSRDQIHELLAPWQAGSRPRRRVL
jgi:IclR family transcriptional regulator, pca regulon regulatory protein